ncbi:MAG: DUF2330 domain-containing protein [Nannocystaceae bacterium]
MNHRRALALLPALGLAITLALQPATAHAFCGFYVSGADAHLYNSATQVVLMRDGNRTVLSMANDYQGPPQDFAMVVPVPVVLQESDVKVLPASIFERVDALAAPRLVEYWEQDPCYMDQVPEAAMDDMSMPEPMMEKASGPVARDLGVTIEAQFTVGEYEIVILSAQDSLGLDTWLRRNRYNIPKGAQYALRPYVHQGMKFFVAKVDVDKVARDPSGRATLSPLRFHYDTPTFSLPVRLGLLNSAGAQDLIIHILSREVRYQVANYKNVTIPTNLEVRDQVRHEFGRFYAALFDRVLLKNPRSVVTEYSWSAASCDPCPVEPLNLDELATLGADVLPRYERVLADRRDSAE